MAISYYSNPIPEIMDGLLKGHQIGMQIQAAKRQEAEFKTQQAMKEQQMSMQDIMNRQVLGQTARPVSDMGTVTSQGLSVTPDVSVPASPGNDPSNGRPAMPATPAMTLPASVSPTIQQPSYTRKADPSRVVKYGGTSYELKTPEEQQQRELAQQTSGMEALQAAKDRAAINSATALHNNQLKLEGGGTPAQGLAAMGVPDGTLLTRDELAHYTQGLLAHIQSQQAIRKGNLLVTGPDQEVWDTSQFGTPGQPAAPAMPGAAPALPTGTPASAGPAPAAPTAAPTATPTLPGATPTAATPPTGAPGLRPIIGGGPKKATGEFGAYLRAFLLKQGFTEANAPPDLVMKATTDYANKSKDPADLEQIRALRGLTIAMTQQKIEDMKAKQGTQTVDYQPGTREYKMAQDLAYGALTLPQLRTLLGRGADSKKLDIYYKATQLNPEFNPAKFELGYKFAGDPSVQKQLAALDNVKNGVDDLLKFSDQAQRSGAPLLNKYLLPGGIAVGSKKYSNFKTAQTAFADELSGALGFGGATDMSKKMGFDMTDPNLSPDAFASAVQSVIVPFLERKRNSLLTNMGVYGEPGMNSSAGAPKPAQAQGGGRGAPGGGQQGGAPVGYLRTAQGPNGHQIGQKADGGWYDVQTGQKVQ